MTRIPAFERGVLHIVALDPATGRTVWTRPSTQSDEAPGVFPALDVAGSGVIALVGGRANAEDGAVARLDARTWKAAPVFGWLQKVGGVPTDDMLRTFNCGLGMIVVVDKNDAPKVTKALTDTGETVSAVGVIERAPTEEADCIVEHADTLWRS